MTIDRAAIAKANAMTRDAMERTIAAGQEIGLQVTAYLRGEEVVNQNIGLADPATGRPVEPDTLFNAFSVAKGIAVTALHLQAERGLIEYDAPVARYWPEFAANGKSGTTVRHVITHVSGTPQMPAGTTIEDMCDWDLMTSRIAALEPVAEPGTQATYQALNHGWLIGEVVRRTDSANRSFGQFVRDELGEPLGAPDLWFGLPEVQEPRVARLVNTIPLEQRAGLHAQAMPMNLSLVPEVFERSDVRRAEIASVGGIFTARSCARIWAMLANGGSLDGVRLLSSERVATFNQPRTATNLADAVLMGHRVAISEAGYWLGGAITGSPTAIYHPGAGNSVAWADLETGLAVAICHNRMYAAGSDNPQLPIAAAIREALCLV